MAIDAKLSLLEQAKGRLASEIPMETMTTVLKVISDVLDGFDINELAVSTERDDLLDYYISAMTVQGLSEKTLNRYRNVIRRMMVAIGVPTKRITVSHLRNYLAKRKDNGTQDSTLEGERQIFSAYFNWLQRESLIDRYPTANLGSIRCAKKHKITYTGSDIEKLRMNCKSIRDRAILEILRSTGCRISEIMGLRRDQVKLNELQCTVHGKGNKDRIAYIDSVAAMCIKQYLESRDDPLPYLFVGQKGKLTESGVRYMLHNLQEKSGVTHVHPHKFRRTLATELARRGMPIQEVARVLGHEKIDTTMRYVILNDDDVKHDYRRFA